MNPTPEQPLDAALRWAELGRYPDDPTVASAIRHGVRPGDSRLFDRLVAAPIAGGARARLQETPGDLRPALAGLIPFTSAAHEHVEPFVDEIFTPGASEVMLDSPHSVPAYGYLRNIWLFVSGSGGVLGTGVLSADYPFNLLSSIQLSDVNGAPIFGPLDGYASLWANIIGGAAGGVNDPRALPFHVATINGVFALRIPVEISHRDGFGSIANQNSAAAYRIHLRGNTSANAFSTAPSTIPAVRVRAFAECWTIPNDTDVLGRPQAQMPPRLGSAQYTSHNLFDVSAGANQHRLQRTGNLLRYLLFIARTSAGARSDTVMTDPVDIQWDARSIYSDITQNYIVAALMREKLPDLTARDAGVFALPFNTSDRNTIGDDAPTFWWPTVQSSRIEVNGQAAAAGRLQVIVNDVAPVEVAPEERYELTSESGFTPEVGARIRQG